MSAVWIASPRRVRGSVVAITACVLVLVACTSRPTSPDTTATAPEGGGQPTLRRLEIGRDIEADGWVVLPEWFGVWVAGGGTLSKIDVPGPRPRRTAAGRSWDYDYVELARYGEGTILLASGERLWVLDARSGITIRKLDLGHLGYVNQVLQVGNATWITANRRSGVLASIDLDSGEAIDAFRLGREVGRFASSAESFFVSGADALLRVDPRSGEVRSVPEGQPAPLVASGSRVWTATGNTIRCVDAVELDSCGIIPTTRAVDVATDRGLLWVLSATGSTSPSLYLPDPRKPATVALYDAASGQLLAGPLELPETTPATITAFRSHAWIGFHDSGHVLRIDLS